MKNNRYDIEYIEALLHQSSDRDVPSGICDSVMDEILSQSNQPGLFTKLRIWCERMTWPILPLKVATMTALTVAAFWLGTEMGSSDIESGFSPISTYNGHTLAAGTARANYLIGMGLLEDGQTHLALEYFHKATASGSSPSAHGRWTENDQWPTGDTDKIWHEPPTSASRQAESILFLLNLAHNLAESGNFQGALYQYEKVLRINPQNQTALYNRAISLHHLGKFSDERQALIGYLDQYRSDRRAYQAVEHLQRLGIFDFQIGVIGGRKIVFNQKILLGSLGELRRGELERLATYLQPLYSAELHLVVFHQHGLEQGKNLAAELKHEIQGILGNSWKIPIRISWFDEPAQIQIAGEVGHEQPQGLFLFTQPSVQQRSKI
jgi:tetratricopeptide (TPR) repeat protein